jgi:hypothetical protein
MRTEISALKAKKEENKETFYKKLIAYEKQ